MTISGQILNSKSIGKWVDEMIAKVIDNRENHTPLHPMTTALDSSIFTIEELAEEDDAVMREKPQYKRNNAKDIDAEMELGDAFYMAATTIMALERGFIEDGIDARGEWLKSMATIKACEARTMIAYWGDGEMGITAKERIEESMKYLITYCEHKGVDPMGALEKSMAKFRRKYGKQE